jgi:hypothetical protein
MQDRTRGFRCEVASEYGKRYRGRARLSVQAAHEQSCIGKQAIDEGKDRFDILARRHDTLARFNHVIVSQDAVRLSPQAETPRSDYSPASR